MKFLQKKYKTVQVHNEGTDAYWIEKTTYLFGHKIWINIIGDYKIETDYGELGNMPFFSLEAAEQRIEILQTV